MPTGEADLKTLFDAAKIPSDEQARIVAQFKRLKSEGYDDAKALAAATGEIARFEREGVKINGGVYEAVDTADGFVVVRDVPIMGEVQKGVKNAPKNIDADWHKKSVGIAQFDYKAQNFAAPIHKGHHKQLAFEDPEFLGFVLPTRAGTLMLDGKEESVIFADYKLKRSAFERAQKGELPFCSVEPDWETGEIMSLALLDSKPPHFKFPLFVKFNLRSDAAAKFEAKLKATMERSGSKVCSACGRKFEKETAMPDVDPKKADTKPVVPNEETKLTTPPQMSADQSATFAKMQAQMAMQADEIAKLQKVNLDRENADKSKARFEKAMADLKGYELGENAKKALFDAAGDEKALGALVAAFKESARREPPKSMEEFLSGGTSPTNPALAKFQKEGNPDKLAKASKYVAQFELAKARGMTGDMTAERWAEISIAEESRGTDK